jgi:hypothetical protein
LGRGIDGEKVAICVAGVAGGRVLVRHGGCW